MDREKKVTLRFDTSYGPHVEILEKINNRDKLKYKSATDYICAAVMEFEGSAAVLPPEDRQLLSNEISQKVVQELSAVLGRETFATSQKPGL